MRSLRKRMERAALGYRKRTGQAACVTMECWAHKGTFSEPPRPETSFRFSWFYDVGRCHGKFFSDIDALESFANGAGLETLEDA